MIILCLILTLCCGCSRTVNTAEDTFFITFTLQTRGSIDTANTNYLFCFSKSNTPDILPETINTDEYFPLPSFSYNQDILDTQDTTLASYYDDYFDTWSDFIIVHTDQVSQQAELISSNDDFFSSTTTDSFTYTSDIGFNYTLAINGSQMTLTIDAAYLALTETDVLYFKFVTTTKESGYDVGYLRDTISDTYSIPIQLQENLILTESENSAIEEASDIASWEVLVF